MACQRRRKLTAAPGDASPVVFGLLDKSPSGICETPHRTPAGARGTLASAVHRTPGASYYLEALTSETNSFNAELTLAQAQGNEWNALVQLYLALGGSWR